MSENNGGSMMGGFLLGAVVGAGLALIFAPMAGDETRRQIRDAARKIKDGARGQMDQAIGAMKDSAGDVGAAIGAGKDEFRRHADASRLAKEPV
jgi:gas vesicle protein